MSKIGVGDVDSVFVGESRVCAFPGCDAAAASAHQDLGGLDKGGTEAVEEVGLSGYGVIEEVGVAELANVDLGGC